MNSGICNISVIPIRDKPNDTSEMTSQILFGESFKILDNKGEWIRIITTYDDYEGWIDKKQYLPVSDEFIQLINQNESKLSIDLVHLASFHNSCIPVLIGSSLPKYDGEQLWLGDEIYKYSGKVVTPNKKIPDTRKIKEYALLYHHAPYLWGGRTPFGIDCSGFTQMVFKLVGIPIKRDTYQQVKQGTTVNRLESAIEGDLAFFENDERKVSHVGIILNENKIIHASGRVRIDLLDENGIRKENNEQYTHQLKIIKRLIKQ